MDSLQLIFDLLIYKYIHVYIYAYIKYVYYIIKCVYDRTLL